MTIHPLRKLTKLLTLKKKTVSDDGVEVEEEVSKNKNKNDGDLDELRPTVDRHGEDDLEEKIRQEKNVHFSDDDEGMNFDEQNEKKDFFMSDGTGTENKTSSENECHVTYAGTDSMYEDPPKKYNRVIHKKNDTRLHKPTYDTSTSNTVKKNT